MIEFTTDATGTIQCVARIRQVGVYLDNDSLGKLAEGQDARRSRFLDALRHHGTLLFSYANAGELAGPQGRSASARRAFLDEIGPNWVPLELNIFTVMERESQGLLGQSPVATTFMEAYVKERLSELDPEGGALLVDMSADKFFRLSAVLDWVQNDRDEIHRETQCLDKFIRDQFAELRRKYDLDPRTLDRLLVSFDERLPTTFAGSHLLRTAAIAQSKKGDGMDLCHAALGVAYGSIATLDSKWKRRVNDLPKPHRLAKTYYSAELDDLVDFFESLS